ncbi:LysR family transcriptional regulator [Pantoea cypripedii]|uniref:LysR family transcriptional regulator n=1 Tax=Pantoea cypripedii TaxID=55209 RepID=UPI002FC83F0D
MKRTDPLGGIAAFVLTARLGSFSAAAQELGLTRSAVTKTVSRLEARLGVKLMERFTRRLVLTPQGESYLQQCRNAFELLDEAESELLSLSAAPSGLLSISLPAGYGHQHVLPHLLEMAAEYRDLTLHVTFGEMATGAGGRAPDVSVIMGTAHLQAGKEQSVITRLRNVICASPGYLSRFGVPESPVSLGQHHCAVRTENNRPQHWDLTASDNSSLRFSPPPSYAFSDDAALLSATLAGVAIALLPHWLAAPYIENGSLSLLFCDYTCADTPVSVVWTEALSALPKVRITLEKMLTLS